MFRKTKRKDSKSNEEVTVRTKGGATDTTYKADTLPKSGASGSFRAPSNRCTCCSRPFGVLQSFRARHCEYCRGSVCGKCYNDRKCHRCFTRQRFDVRSVEEFRQLDRESLLRMLTSLHVPRVKVEESSRADIITEILTRCGLGEQLRLYRDSLKQEEQVEVKQRSSKDETITEVITTPTIKEVSEITDSTTAIIAPKSDGHTTTQAQIHVNLKALSTEADVRQLPTDALRALCGQPGDESRDPAELVEQAVLLWHQEHDSQIVTTESATPKSRKSTSSPDTKTTVGGATSTTPARASSTHPPLDLSTIKTEAELKSLTTKELASILKDHGINQKQFSEKNEMLREVLQLWREAQRAKQPATTKPETKENSFQIDSLQFEEDLQKLGTAELKLFLFHHGIEPAPFPEKSQLLQEAVRIWRETRVYENLPSKSKGPLTPKSTMNPIYEENEPTQASKKKSLADGILQSEEDLRQLSAAQLKAILNSFDIKTETNDKEVLVTSVLTLLQSPITPTTTTTTTTTTSQLSNTATKNGLFLRDIKSEEFIHTLNVSELKSLLQSCGVNGTDQFTERYELVNLALRLWREEMKSNQSKNRKSTPIKKEEPATLPASRKGPARPNESKIVEVTSWKDKQPLTKMVTEERQAQIATPKMENLKFRADIEKLSEQQLRSILRRGNITVPPSTAKPELVEAVANLWLQQKHTAVSSSSSSESIASSSSQLSSTENDDSVVANATTTTVSTNQLRSTPTAEEIGKMNIKQLMSIVREHGLTPTKLLDRKELAEEVIVLLSRKRNSEMDKRRSQKDQSPANLKPIASASVVATLEEIKTKEEISKMDAATLRSILALKGHVLDTEQHQQLVSAVIKLWETQNNKRDQDNSMPKPVAAPPPPAAQQQQAAQKVLVTMSTMSRASTGDAREVVVLSDIASEDEIRGLDLYNLKTILTQSRIRHEGFAERREYIDEVSKLWRLQHQDVVDGGGSGQGVQKVTATISNLETPKTPAKELTLEEIGSEDVIQNMHIFNLKSILQSNGQMPIGERQDLVNDVKNLYRKHQAALQMQRRELERQRAAEMAAATGLAPPPPTRPPAGVTRRSFLERIKASSRNPSATAPAATSGGDRDLDDIRSEAEVRELSYQNLKTILVKRNVSTRRLLRKQDLQKEVLAVWRSRPPASPTVLDDDVLLLDEIRSESQLDSLSEVNLKIILKICEPGTRASWALGTNGEGHLVTRAELLERVRQLWRKQAIIPTLDQLGSLEEIGSLETEQLKSILRKDLHDCKEKAELVIRVQFLYSLNKRRGQLSPPPIPDKESSDPQQSTDNLPAPSFPPPPPPEVASAATPIILGIASETEIPYLSIAQIKQILSENEVNVEGCADKDELVERLTQFWQQLRANATPPADTVMV